MVVVSAVAILPAATAATVGASTPIEQQEQEVQRITDELERLHQESDVLAEDYVAALDSKNQLDAEVVDAEARVAAKEAEVGELRGELAEVAVRSFTNSGTDALGPMFNDSATYTDGLQRDQLSRVALSTGTATTDELDHAVGELNDERDALDDLRAEAAAQAERVDEARTANEQRRQEYETAHAAAEAKLGDLIQEEEERRARESYERMQREAEAAAAAQAAAEQHAAAEAQAREAADRQAQAQATAANEASSNDSSTSASSSSNSSSSNSSSSNSSSSSSSSGNALASAPAPQAPEPRNPDPEPEPEEPSYPPSSSRAGTAVNAAMSQLGVPYRFASAEPGVAFDCSGLTSWAWGQAGVYLPHQSRQQYGVLPHVPSSAAQPGDLIFFYSPISHVSIYLGGGQQVHAPNTGTTVKTGTVNWGNVTGVGRPG